MNIICIHQIFFVILQPRKLKYDVRFTMYEGQILTIYTKKYTTNYV